jgi:hypothetical protein
MTLPGDFTKDLSASVTSEDSGETTYTNACMYMWLWKARSTVKMEDVVFFPIYVWKGAFNTSRTLKCNPQNTKEPLKDCRAFPSW